MEHPDDGREFVLQPRCCSTFAECQASVLDGFQHTEGFVQRQHNAARNGVVEGVRAARAAILRPGCDGVPRWPRLPAATSLVQGAERCPEEFPLPLVEQPVITNFLVADVA